MRTILLVDDDKNVRARMKSALAPHRGELTVLEASHGAEAVQRIDEQPVDLVIVDLWMPVVDGFQVLVHVMNHHPTLPVVVMSDHDGWEGLQGLGMAPQVPVLSKRVSALSFLFEVSERLRAGVHGGRMGVTLLGFLQLLTRERRTCRLEVGAGEQTGVIHVLAGEIIHAGTAGQEGEAALVAILGWREPRLHMVSALPELKLTIPTRRHWLLSALMGLDEGVKAQPHMR
jgi:CheY-like chemotaxis protein